MKKHWFTVLCVVLSVAILSIAGATAAKYIAMLFERDGVFQAADYYFRSNVLTDSSDPTPITVSGNAATFTLANGADQTHYANVKIEYDIEFWVMKDDNWVMADSETDCVFNSGDYRHRTVEFGPVVYDGVLYKDILVKAISTAPYEKTLYGRVVFDYQDYSVSCVYTDFPGYITVTVATNGMAGDYRFTWQKGIMPDQSDPNLILTEAPIGAEGGTSTDGYLDANTVYTFVFFVNDADALTELNADASKASQYVACELLN